MSWDSFTWYACGSALLWICGAAVSVKSARKLPAALLSGAGTVLFLTFIIGFWADLGRPPLRTMGETRLWFSLFLSSVGLAVYLLRGHRWVLPFSSLMAAVFVCINIFKPEIHSKTLMPALQSPWFIPHVIVYMFAYAVMGLATILAVKLLCFSKSADRKKPEGLTGIRNELVFCDSLVRMGWGFLTMGIVMGALWAKQAWGDYWTWDPKETWAAATWLSYLLYLHLRQLPEKKAAEKERSRSTRNALLLLIFSFILLQMCWWGVNYLPSAQGFSLHTY